MKQYIFIGAQPRIYNGFTANPGDERQFDNPPTDGQWVLASTSAPAPAKDWFDDTQEKVK
jgi:hypothetical protein